MLAFAPVAEVVGGAVVALEGWGDVVDAAAAAEDSASFKAAAAFPSDFFISSTILFLT